MEHIKEKFLDLEKRCSELLTINMNLEKDLKNKNSLAKEAIVNLARLTLKHDNEVEQHQYHLAIAKYKIKELQSTHQDTLLQLECIKTNISLELKSDFTIHDFSQCLQSYLMKAMIEKQSLNEEILELKATVSQKMIEVLDSHDKIKSLRTEIRDKEEAEEILNRKVVTMYEGIEELKTCLKYSEDKTLKFKTVLENQNKTIVELNKELDTNSQNSVNDKSDIMVVLYKVFEMVQTQTYQVAQFKLENTELLNRLGNFQSGEREKNTKIQELMQELSNIKKQHSHEISLNIDQHKSSNKKISSLEESLLKSNKENTDLMKNQNILTIELSDLKEKYTALIVDKSQLEISLKKSEEHMQKKSSEVVNETKYLEGQLETLKSELVSKTDEVNDLRSQVNVLNDKNSNLSKHIQDISPKLDSSDALVKELTENLESEKQLSDLNQQLANEEKLKRELRKECDVLKKELKAENSRNKIALRENYLFKEEVDDLKTELYENGSRLMKLREKSVSLKKNLKEAKSTNQAVSKEKSIFKEEIDNLKTELLENGTRFQKLIEYETELELLQAANKELSEFNRQMENYLVDGKDRVGELEKSREELQVVVDSQIQEISALQNQLSSEQLQHEHIIKGELDALREKDDIIISLKSDNKAMKERLVQLIKDKDVLWRMMFKQKEQASEVWMDSNTVTNCLVCKSEFSLFHRKYHCRLCGKICCYNCSNNWMMTTSSRKKERVCNRCFERPEMFEMKSLPLPSESLSSNDYSGKECSTILSMGSSLQH